MRLNVKFAGSCAIAAGRNEIQVDWQPESGSAGLRYLVSVEMTNAPPFYLCRIGDAIEQIDGKDVSLNEGDVIKVVPVLLGG